MWPWYRGIFFPTNILIFTLNNELEFDAVVSDGEMFYLSETFHVVYLTKYPKPLNQITRLKDAEGYFV